VRSAATPSPAAKLALALVTEPEESHSFLGGTTPVAVREDAMRTLLQTGADAGVTLIATRPSGDGERLLGQSWPFPSPFSVSVRTVALSEGLDRVEARARRSLERMGLPRGDVLLASACTDLAGAEGRALWDRMRALKDRGLYRRIGFLATMEDGPTLLARRFQPDVVQIPCNIMDQRPVSEGVLSELAALGVDVHVSSVFSRGLLFASRETLPSHLAEYGQAVSRTRRRLAEARVDPMQAALAFCLGLPPAAAVVTSVASAAELRAVLAAAHAPRPDLDWEALALQEPAALTGSRHRISSAA
jgi:aryl-alcohol dehydrogenase-like predicted oxidoreductase